MELPWSYIPPYTFAHYRLENVGDTNFLLLLHLGLGLGRINVVSKYITVSNRITLFLFFDMICLGDVTFQDVEVIKEFTRMALVRLILKQ